jgi:hypothetical protein
MSSMRESVVAQVVSLRICAESHPIRSEMFADYVTVSTGAKHAGNFGPAYRSDTLTEIGSHNDENLNPARQTGTKNVKCSGFMDRSTRRGCSRTASISRSTGSNIPNSAKSLGVHQLARVDVEPRRDQPTDGGRWSLPDLDLHVGRLQDTLDALVDSLGNAGSATPSRANDSTTLGMGPVGDSTLMRRVKGKQDEKSSDVVCYPRG